MTSVTLNGEPRLLPDDATLETAVRETGADVGRGVAAAVDGEVVPRGRWEELSLRDGQVIEVLRAVQGG
jgi:sulfur carrier protein